MSSITRSGEYKVDKIQIISSTGITEINFETNVLQIEIIENLFSNSLFAEFIIKDNDNNITIKRPNDSKDSKSKHGLYRSLIANMFEGLSKGFKHELELHGVGYRASNTGQKLDLSLGYSHNIILEICNEVKVTTQTEKGQNPKIIDKKSRLKQN